MTVNRGWAIAVLGDAAEGESRVIEGTLMAEAFGAEYLRGSSAPCVPKCAYSPAAMTTLTTPSTTA